MKNLYNNLYHKASFEGAMQSNGNFVKGVRDVFIKYIPTVTIGIDMVNPYIMLPSYNSWDFLFTCINETTVL